MGPGTSRFLFPYIYRSVYTVIELELLAITWVVMKCNIFATYWPSPLIPILNMHCLDEIDYPQMQCLKTQLMAFNFPAEWFKGSTNQAPDALSCSLWLSDENNPDLSIAELRVFTQKTEWKMDFQITKGHSMSHVKYTGRYVTILQLTTVLLYIYGCWLLISSQMRRTTIEQLHEPPQGAIHTKQQAGLWHVELCSMSRPSTIQHKGTYGKQT